MNTSTQTNSSATSSSPAQPSNPTNFEKVQEFSRVFGVPTHNTPQTDIFTKDPALTKLRLDLVTEECQELVDAVKEHNFTEVVDALADILYVVYGAASSFGVDLDKAFDIVHRSNMSKVCKSEEEAQRTVTWYTTHMADTYPTPSYRRSDCGRYWVVFNKDSGKILKSVAYTPAKFDMEELGLNQGGKQVEKNEL